MRAPLRVLADASALADGRRDAGIGRYIRELTAALAEIEDIQLTIETPKQRPWSDSRPGRFLRAQPGLLRTARRLKPDVAHGLGGEPIVGLSSSRQVVTIHDVEMWRATGPTRPRDVVLRAYAMSLLGLYRRCAALIAVSRASAEEAITTLDVAPERVHVVPEGVSPVFTSAATDDDIIRRRAIGVPEQPYVLWTGSLRHSDPRKGLDVLLEALSRLRPAQPTLVMAGPAGEESRRIAWEAQRLSLVVILTGARSDDDLAALYRGATAMVLSSNHEGFGLPVLEAMACGAPVVATSVGNLPDLAGDVALLVPPRDPAALAGGLRMVLEDRERANRMREAGPVRAAGYTWSRAAALTADVYRAVAGRQ